MVECVDLLDPDVEPTDEQLAALMQEVAVEAREKYEKALASLYQDITRQTDEIRARYGLKTSQERSKK